ncbi:hypothetical protein RRG08_054954 [Elysia crispata]|uniref:Uncharacterized protein n=1 Tax=Elysia crispata TaxID=231223 RepID=A0AAE0YYG4_9GAST|nr:hypothetical protein RRG08_054954 [Elysia crispata]
MVKDSSNPMHPALTSLTSCIKNVPAKCHYSGLQSSDIRYHSGGTVSLSADIANSIEIGWWRSTFDLGEECSAVTCFILFPYACHTLSLSSCFHEK